MCCSIGRTGPLTMIFKPLDIAEKCLETMDEIYHLSHPIIEKYGTLEFQHEAADIHAGAHKGERLLHSFCILGDISRMLTGEFIDRFSDNKIDWLRTMGRVCLTVSHCFATSLQLQRLNFGQFGQVQRLILGENLFSMIGYGLWMTALIWNQSKSSSHIHLKKEEPCKEEKNHKRSHFGLEAVAYCGGALYSAMSLLTQHHAWRGNQTLNKVASLASLIHANAVIQILIR